MIGWIQSLFSGLMAPVFSFLGGWLLGWRKKQVSELKSEVKAHEKREKVEDKIRKTPFDVRREDLKKWSAND